MLSSLRGARLLSFLAERRGEKPLSTLKQP